MRILGMVTHTHDTGIALVKDGVPEFVIEEERLNREKKTQQFPAQALDTALSECGLSIHDIDVITMPWDIPRFRRTLAWAILRKFPYSMNLIHMRSHPVQQNQLFRGTRYLAARLREHFGTDRLPPIVGVGHHNSHAAGYFMSPLEDATVLVMDGYGDDAATSVYTGEGNRLRRQWHTNMFNSLGILYTVVTQHLGFQPNQDEGKVMGLAAYGEPTYLEAFRDVIRRRPGGRYRINMKYFDYDCHGLDRPIKALFAERFGPPRQTDEPITEHHHDLAFALQTTVEETILHIANDLSQRYPSRNLFLSGGVALNCVANAKILEQTDFERIWIPPNPSDTGAPLGSALWHYHQSNHHPRCFKLEHAFYGKEYSQDEIEQALCEFGLSFEALEEEDLIRRVACDLAAGKIVGWFQGRFEMGPRALGNRSILADPRRKEMKDILNRRVKHREPFRPFAPAILRERAGEWFHIEQADPFMTIAPSVRKEKAHLIPSGVHKDQTARVQTVERNTNPRYYALIEAFEKLTGVPIVLNTSFNRQEPIVARPQEAISCFLRTDMDVLVLGNCYSADHNDQSVRQATSRFSTAGV
jgi:carbamoyltransferase